MGKSKVTTTAMNVVAPTAHPLYVGSLEKGFRVLAAFGDDCAALGVTEIALRTGLDKSAAQRFSNTLHQINGTRIHIFKTQLPWCCGHAKTH
jgi:hypothetical protein